MKPSPLGDEEREILRPPCVKPLPPQGEAVRVKLSGWSSPVARLTVTNWKWPNAPLHFSIFFSSEKCSAEREREREGKGWLKKITFSPPRTFLSMKTYGLIPGTCHRDSCSRTTAPTGFTRLPSYSKTRALTQKMTWCFSNRMRLCHKINWTLTLLNQISSVQKQTMPRG